MLLPAALFVLAPGLQSIWVAVVYALVCGMANGMITIVKATAMATYVSRERAASLSGLLGLPTALSPALAPSALAALWVGGGSYSLGLSAMCALATWKPLRSGRRSGARSYSAERYESVARW